MSKKSLLSDPVIRYSVNTPINEEIEKPKLWFPIRYVMVFMVFVGMINAYAIRNVFSVSIVEMVTKHNISTGNGTFRMHQDFNWTRKQQGLLLSAFFYGYTLVQIPVGFIANRFGGKYGFGFGILLSAILTIITPFVAYLGFWWLIALRALEGVFQSIVFPSHLMIWSKWAPNLEKTKMISYALCGINIAIVITNPITGLLCANYGWQSAFYVIGGSSVVCCIIWFIFASDLPEQNKFMSENEALYIVSNRHTDSNTINLKEVPWRAILTSVPFYAVVVTMFCDSWGFYTLQTELPSYMKDVLKFDIAANGLLSGVPYIVYTISQFSCSILVDYLRERRYLSTTNARKIFASIGFIGQAVFLLLTGYTETRLLAILSLSIALGFTGVETNGVSINIMDIGPKYVGLLMGISNCISSISGIISPSLSGLITKQKTVAEWRIVFFISAGMYVVGAITSILFASGEIQPWSL